MSHLFLFQISYFWITVLDKHESLVSDLNSQSNRVFEIIGIFAINSAVQVNFRLNRKQGNSFHYFYLKRDFND